MKSNTNKDGDNKKTPLKSFLILKIVVCFCSRLFMNGMKPEGWKQLLAILE